MPTDNMLAAPAYEQAYLKFFQRAMESIVATDTLLGSIVSTTTRHEGPRRNVRGDTPLDQPLMTASAPSTLTFAAVRETDIEAHSVMIFETAQEMIAARHKGFFASTAAVSDAAGNTIKGDGTGAPTIEQMREMLRNMDMEFDDDGRLSSNITLAVAPEAADVAKALVAAAEQDPECIKIALKKREEWFEKRATERTRKLR